MPWLPFFLGHLLPLSALQTITTSGSFKQTLPVCPPFKLFETYTQVFLFSVSFSVTKETAVLTPPISTYVWLALNFLEFYILYMASLYVVIIIIY